MITEHKRKVYDIQASCDYENPLEHLARSLCGVVDQRIQIRNFHLYMREGEPILAISILGPLRARIMYANNFREEALEEACWTVVNEHGYTSFRDWLRLSADQIQC